MSIQKLYTSLSKTAVSSTYVGDQGRIWYDSVAGFRISNGVTPGGLPAVIAVTNANIGNLVITGATISTLNTNEEMTLASNGTGNVRVKGAFLTETTSGRTIVETLQNGTMNFYVPTIGYDSAIDIIGSSDGSQVAPQNTGVLLHLTGQDSLPARIYNDSSNNYPAFIGRRYNGSSSAPTQVLAGNIIARYGATPYGSSGWPSISTARLDFVSLEDQTSTNQGTSIEFYTTPLGAASSVPSMTVASTGITNAANVTPNSDETYYLGTPTLRWQGVYVGKGGLTIADSTTNVNVPISVNNGTLYLTGVQNIAIGNLVVTDNTLESISPSTDIKIGDTSDTGFLIIGRTVQIRTQNLNTEAALLINGSLSNIVPPEYPNTLMHTINVPGYNSVSLTDNFSGAGGTFAGMQGRSARGTIQAPTATQSSDVLFRLSGAGYGATGFDTAFGTQGGSRIDFRATENYTDTAKGSDIHFWTTQPGTSSTVNSGTVDYRGFSGNSFIFTTDNTTQTTAGIPMTYRGNLSATKVATLGVDGTLDSSQIPSSLVGGVQYKGGWDANANSPTLVNGSGTAGWEYSITTTGTRNLGAGSQTYQAGGFIIYNGSVWTYIAPVSNFTSLTAGTHLSVDTPVGAINLTTDATPTFTASTIVSRDSSGNFVANVITATLTGTATSATTAGTVTGNIQTAITQVGTLVSLGVTGNITAGNVSAASGTISATNGVFTNIINQFVTINSNVTAANLAISTLQSNVGAYESFANVWLSNLQSNVTTLFSNASTQNTWLSNLQANIVTINSNVTAANSAIATNTSSINSLATGANANVASYLTTATGNISAGNLAVAANGTLTTPKIIINDGGLRTVSGGTPTITLNFGTDSIIHVYQPAGTVTFQYGTLVAGSSVRCLINFATARNIVTGVSARNNINLGGETNVGGIGNAPAPTANTLAQLLYNCVDGTAANTYCTISYT